GGEGLGDQSHESFGSPDGEVRLIDRAGRRDPENEENGEPQAYGNHRADGGVTQYAQGVAGIVILPPFAPPAQFIKPQRRDRADEGETRGERIEQGEGRS